MRKIVRAVITTILCVIPFIALTELVDGHRIAALLWVAGWIIGGWIAFPILRPSVHERIGTAMDEYSKAHGKEWLPHEERNRLRKKQDKIIKIAARQNLPMDSPISSAEGAPTIA